MFNDEQESSIVTDGERRASARCRVELTPFSNDPGDLRDPGDQPFLPTVISQIRRIPKIFLQESPIQLGVEAIARRLVRRGEELDSIEALILRIGLMLLSPSNLCSSVRSVFQS